MKNFSLAKDWMNLIEKVPGDHPNVPAGSCSTDPFVVITEESNTLPVNAARAVHAPQDQPPKHMGQMLPREETSAHHPSPSLPSLSGAAVNLATKR